MSDITKGYKTKSILTFWISVLLNVVPMVVFFIMGFATAPTEQKVILSFTAVASAILGGIMLLSKAKLNRTLFWIVFLVLYFCMQELWPLIIVMGCCTFLDDLVVSPLHHRWNTDYHTNKQIDKRE